MKNTDISRTIVTLVILGAFIYAVINHWSQGIEETLKNVVIAGVMYWLGSSKGSSDKTKMLDERSSGLEDDPVFVEDVEKIK